MPFTPLHMGPGLALKAIAGRHFSVLVFGVAQVAMDIEPLVGMLRGADVLHGWSHSVVGATLIGLAVFLLAPPLCRAILARWNRELSWHRLDWLRSDGAIGRLPAATGAFAGTYSHLLLDSIMHSDMVPLWPLSAANGMLGLISIEALHALCVATGLAGVLAWLAAGWGRRQATPGD